MKHTFKSYLNSDFKSDFRAGLVVFLVAIPLCLGIALASGAPLMSGIIAGLVGGIVVGVFGGSAQGVSGPAAGLVAVVLAGIAAVGSFEAFLLVTILAGAIMYVFGWLGAGAAAYYVPSSVIKGMLAAIGVIIIMKQLPYILGYDELTWGKLGLFSFNKENLPYLAKVIEPGAIIITAVGLLILVGWSSERMKGSSLAKIIPGPLVAVAVGVGLQLLFNAFVPALAISTVNLVQLPTSIEPSKFFTVPDFTAIVNPEVWFYAFVLAAVAGIESLLVADATDKLDPQKRITPMNKELRAQGIANLVSGFLGGLPLTQVIVRSTASIASGAKTRGAAIIHGIFILVSVVSFPFVLNLIPLASLAAILLMVGFKLTKPAVYTGVWKKGWTQFIPFVATIVGILATDLLIGIGIGTAVAVVFILRKKYRIPFFFDYSHRDGRVHIDMVLVQIVSFINKGEILATLQLIPDDAVLTIDASRTVVIDPDVMEVLEDFFENARHRNITVELVGFNQPDKIPAPAQELRQLLDPKTHLKEAAPVQ